jgi:hypothetical protein
MPALANASPRMVCAAPVFCGLLPRVGNAQEPPRLLTTDVSPARVRLRTQARFSRTHSPSFAFGRCMT